MDAMTANLGRFDHHPDASTDFCVEVEALIGLQYDMRAGLATPDEIASFLPRIDRALEFRVGGDPIAIQAKQALRDLAGIPQPPFPA